jgi:hypothetical protein
MVDITEVSAIVAAAGVIVGVVLTVLEVRNLVKQRQTDLIMRLYSHFGSKEIQEAYFAVRTMEFKDYDEYMKKYGPPTGPTMAQVGMFFNGIGVLLQKKLVDIELVDVLFGAEVKLAWKAAKVILDGRRRDLNEPKIYEGFEYVYNEVKKREQRK